MRVPLIPLLLFLTVCLACDLYIWRAIGTRLRRPLSKKLQWVHIGVSLILYGVLITAMSLPRRSGSDQDLLDIMWMMFTFMSFYVPKTLFCIIDLCASVPKLWKRHRIGWLSRVGAVVGGLLLVSMWWGALGGRYSTQVREVNIYIPDLPAAFEGYTIAQFSDFHVGTYGQDTTYVSKVVDRLNALDADIIVFTGDIVNRHTEELLPFVGPLSRLSAHDGVYSILGNHDYGDYHEWPDAKAKEQNRTLLIDLNKEMGWRLLLNETEFLHRGNDSIALIGVENIGDPPFPIYGSLDTSYDGNLGDAVTKILLSHNPAHWTMDIEKNDDINIALTLAGHTHAMQIELLGLSPAVFRYPKWGGLYRSDSDPDKQLYVNIGLGTVAIPMRLGARPELTLFTLTSKNPKS